MAKKIKLTFEGTELGEIQLGTANHDLITGLAGSDTISGGSGSDSIYGGADDDLIYGGGGSDILDGGEGDDAVYGGKGDDRMTAGLGLDTVDGGAGLDTASFATTVISADVSLIDGTSVQVTESTGTTIVRNTETLTFFGEVFKLATGTADADTFDFAATTDLIVTGAGADVIHTYSAGYGPAQLTVGRDVVTDFDIQQDTLIIHVDPNVGLPYAGYNATDENGLAGAYFYFGVGSTIFLSGVDINSLTEANFQLVPNDYLIPN